MLNNNRLLISSVVEVVKPSVTTPGGEKLALNKTGDGVLVWYHDYGDGQDKLMAVALASARGVSAYGGGASSFSGLAMLEERKLDSNTAKYNTSVIISHCPTNSAAAFCRTKTINSSACDLPNIQELGVIHDVKYYIDNLDPTVSNYQTYRLSNWGFGAKVSKYCVSSSIKNNIQVWCIAAVGENDSAMRYTYSPHYTMGVIPILELDPITQQPLS